MAEKSGVSSRKIGPYAVVGLLARGATSEVVKALDPDLNRVVAIKLLSREFARDEEAIARFEGESRALLPLNHPNVARIFEAAITLDGQPYFVMELVDGESLQELILNKVDLAFSLQLDLIIQAAEGLRAALNHNIFHRDIKPANLMVDRDYRLKVVDFGLAKVIGERAYQSIAGKQMGTPRYMAPEVALGRSADYRSDLYSLGATFYHLLTGRPPFDGETPAAVMMQHVGSPVPPPHLINPQIPADVCDIVLRAMEKDPNQRYQDYDEMLSDLKGAKVARLARERGEEPPAAPVREWEEPPPAPVQERAEPPRTPVREFSREEIEPREDLSAAVPWYAPPGGAEEKPPAAPPRRKVGDSYWTWRANKRLKALVAVFAVLVAALIYAAWPAARENSDRGLRSLVGVLVGRLTRHDLPEDEYYHQYMASLRQIDLLALGVKEYLLTAKRYPDSFDDLVKRRIILRTDFVDGFGGAIQFEPATHYLRAAGPDRVLGSGDDFLADENGKILLHPPEPERLAVEQLSEIRERGKKPDPDGP